MTRNIIATTATILGAAVLLGTWAVADAAPSWPITLAGELCMEVDNGLECTAPYAWRLFDDGTVLASTFNGHRRTGTWSYDPQTTELGMTLAGDRDGDGVLDYSVDFVGTVVVAQGCAFGTWIDNLVTRQGEWQGCVL